MQAFEDRPLIWDAWDVDIFYDDKMWLADPATSVNVVEAGPLRATLEVKRRVLNSELVQRISLRHDAAQVDFDTWIDWQDRHIMLKVAFPADVLTPQATYEIQWGNVERPTHRNTSWDWARFETCAQKWVDLSEGDYGISVLNDCKYGHDIRDNVVRISLLRGATSPDPTADIGEQRFSYSLRPHAGSWDEQTVAAAYALNDPLIAVSGVAAPIDATHSRAHLAGLRRRAEHRRRDRQACRGRQWHHCASLREPTQARRDHAALRLQRGGGCSRQYHGGDSDGVDNRRQRGQAGGPSVRDRNCEDRAGIVTELFK